MLAGAEPEMVRSLTLLASLARTAQAALVRWRVAACTPVVWALRTARRVPVWLRSSDDLLWRAKSEIWSRVSAAAIAARARAIASVDVQLALACLAKPMLHVR